jgi:hypothetical protein
VTKRIEINLESTHYSKRIEINLESAHYSKMSKACKSSSTHVSYAFQSFISSIIVGQLLFQSRVYTYGTVIQEKYKHL